MPAKSNGFTTHSCFAVLEMIETGILNATMDPSVNVKVIEQEVLAYGASDDVTPSDMFKHMATGPIMFRSFEIEENMDFLQPPSWWKECSAQLKTCCHGAIPDGSTFSSYEPCLRIMFSFEI